MEDPASTEAETTQPTAPPNAEELELHVGVGQFTDNLNPHLTGNVNPVVMGIADLTLPSTFRRAGESWEMDPDLLKSVQPNDPAAPTEVTYTLNPAAQWSDGTPVTISDFRYLSEEIGSNPAASEAASYGLIKSIEPSRSGAIVVKFSEPFAGWQTLFRHLLPSHIYGAENHPFSTMMDGAMAASGGAYSVSSIDEGRGKVELRRNDRYWGISTAATDRLIFDRMPDLSTGMQMLRSQQIEMMISQPSEITNIALKSLPDVQHRTVDRGVDLSLSMNVRSSVLDTAEKRGEVLRELYPALIAQIATENAQAQRPAQPEIEAVAVSAPGQGEPQGEVPAPEDMRKLGRSEADGVLVIGAPTDDQAAVSAARVAADQLKSAGIAARVVTKEASALFREDVPGGTVDMLVSWQKTARSGADYLDQFSCVERKTAVRAGVASDKKLLPYSGNVTGYCDPELNKQLGAVVTGQSTLDSQRGSIEGHIAEANIVVPLVRDQLTVALGEGIEGPAASLDAWAVDPYSAVMVTAPEWKKRHGTSESVPLEGEN